MNASVPDVFDAPDGPVAVAASGGADSLYALAGLQDQGREVFALHGVFFQPQDEAGCLAAAGVRERLSAVCARLGIALHIVDFSQAFREQVLRPFVHSYAQGRTPNPCALCNARIKFGLLREAALALGAARLATGHYACLEADPARPGRMALLQGADQSRDQSYFLALTPLAALASALFPLADIAKKDALAALAAQGLSAPQPGESREVCFIPGDDYRLVLPGLARELGINLPGPGPMLLEDGGSLGTHQGLWRHTEGQRRGLGVGWKEPLYVLGKESENNVLRLGPKASVRLCGCLCREVNLLLPPEEWPERVLVKTRYREAAREAKARLLPAAQGMGLHIEFAGDGTLVAPGQVAALYVPWSGDSGSGRLRLIAGAVIERGL